jgi:polar amino acid transport system substrate-binding protein
MILKKMIRINYRYLLRLWLGFACSLGLSVQAREVIHITNANWPPYQSPTANHFGVASHLVTEIFKISDIGVQYDFLPDNRAIQLTKLGLYDATFLWALSSERQQFFEFSPPLISIKEALLSTKDAPLEITDYSQLKDHRIGVVLGFYYGEAFEKAKKEFDLLIQTAMTNEENLARLLYNKVDFIVGVPESLKLIARQYYPNKLMHLKTHPLVVQETDYYVLFSKKSTHLHRWKAAFEYGFAQLKKTQDFDRIINSALSGKYDPPVE